MATTLAQLVAVEQGVRTRSQEKVNKLYQLLEKTPLFSGLSRTYQKRDDDGDDLPPESVLMQLKSEDMLDQLTESMTRLIDVTATKDAANCRARGDIVVDGVTLAAQVPVTTLMFLEKQVENISTFVSKLPQLNPTMTWHYDDAVGAFRSDPVGTIKTKKIPRNHVKAEATEHHPAQVDVFSEDVVVGEWTKIEFSGAMKADRLKEITERVEKLRTAVKFAREQANTIEVADVRDAESLLSYVFHGSTNGNGGTRVSG